MSPPTSVFTKYQIGYNYSLVDNSSNLPPPSYTAVNNNNYNNNKDISITVKPNAFVGIYQKLSKYTPLNISVTPLDSQVNAGTYDNNKRVRMYSHISFLTPTFDIYYNDANQRWQPIIHVFNDGWYSGGYSDHITFNIQPGMYIGLMVSNIGENDVTITFSNVPDSSTATDGILYDAYLAKTLIDNSEKSNQNQIKTNIISSPVQVFSSD
jgi:hypothetical protein